MSNRGWCFTVNNYSEIDLSDVEGMSNRAVYCIYGFEIGEQGTPHIQGYVYFKSAKSLNVVHKYVPRGHFIKAKGTARDSYNYIANNKDKPDPKFVEVGEIPESGKITKQRMEEVMADPVNNIRLFNQYRKCYAEIKQMDRSKMYLKVNYYFCKLGDIDLFSVVFKDKNIVHVFKFDELEAYSNYDVVCLHLDRFDSDSMVKYIKMYAKGLMKPMYKYGYEQRVVYCSDLIIVAYNQNVEVELIRAGYKYIKDLVNVNGVEEKEF